jgi:Acetyltransferases
MYKIEIKPAEIQQAYTVAEIIQNSFEKQAEVLHISKEKNPNYVAFETPDKVINCIKSGEKVVLLCLDGKPIGTVRYNIDSKESDKGHISRLAVSPEFRGHGYGQMLTNYAESQLKDLNVKIFELSIVAEFDRLKKYYEGLGYVPKEEKVFSTLPFNVLFMRKDISLLKLL